MRSETFVTVVRGAAIVSFVTVLVAGWNCAMAQEGGEADSGGGLRAATQNPISSMYSLPFKFTFDNGADNGDANFLNIQPVLPVTKGDWNLVTHHSLIVGTDVPVTNVVTPDRQDVGFLGRALCLHRSHHDRGTQQTE